jgi:hypothetical protein
MQIFDLGEEGNYGIMDSSGSIQQAPTTDFDFNFD